MALLFSFFLMSHVAQAQEFGDDPIKDMACASLLCLYGSVVGSDTGEACDIPLDEYYAVRKYSHGKLICYATIEMRLAYLHMCEENEMDIDFLVNCDKG